MSLWWGVLKAQDKAMFGENAASCVAQAIVYPAVFGPFPATFDTVAFGSVVDDVMAEQMKLPEKQRFLIQIELLDYWKFLLKKESLKHKRMVDFLFQGMYII